MPDHIPDCRRWDDETHANCITILNQVPTHEVANQPPPLEDDDLYVSDPVLDRLVTAQGAGHRRDDLARFGKMAGSARYRRWGVEANRNPPVLHTHDRYGNRVDEVDFHPSWHHLLETSVSAGMHSVSWDGKPGGWVARAVFNYLDSQIEAGHWCPISMTGAAIASLRKQPELAAQWEPLLTSTVYDPSPVPISGKRGALTGMGMTEKQGGSDVRANTTTATALDTDGEYVITGHKWFTSAPMCDGFLILAQTDAGLTCFLMPRWLDDGRRNTIRIQRLKDKLGNRSNASAELEFEQTWARRIGEEGGGIPTILGMVSATRLDCVAGSAALMRQAVSQAVHHTRYRHAFGASLIDKPLMRNVLADLEIESRAATVMMMRLAGAFDRADGDPTEAAIRRILTPVAKYWVTKRAPAVIGEALECLGGNGYVEDSGLPRLFRESPLNAIWEGSGNVIALDVMRVLARERDSAMVLLDEIETLIGGHPGISTFVTELRGDMESPDEVGARRLTEKIAVAAQAAQLAAFGDDVLFDAFVVTRIQGDRGHLLGTLPTTVDLAALLGT